MIKAKYGAMIVCLITIVTACTKPFTLDDPGTGPRLVIEGRISSLQGPYLVRITKSTNELTVFTQFGGAEPVMGALVIISDDMGVRDTLVPPESVPLQRYIYRYEFPDYIFDSSITNEPSNIIFSDKGYYQTTKIVGIAGHTYHLEVQVDGKKFEASAFMPPVPSLDSAVLRDTIVNGLGERVWLPLVWFREPQQERNYYQLMFNDLYGYPYDRIGNIYDNRLMFPHCLVDDKMLPAAVNGLAIQIPVSSHNPYGNGFNYPPVTLLRPQGQQIKLTSLTKETFNYFSQLLYQFQDDGNIYKPAPASARGNISGGALGHFYATDVSYKLIFP